MTTVVIWLIFVSLMWVVSMVALLLSRRFVDMSFPPLGGFLWRSAVLVLVPVAVFMAFSWIFLVGFVLAHIMFLHLATKLFDLEMHQAVLLTAAFWSIQILSFIGIAAGIAALIRFVAEGSV